MRLRVASYNIHRCVGRDGRYDPGRVTDVIHQLNADIIGIQEIDSHAMTPEGHQLNFLIHHTHYHAIAGPTLFKEGRHYGNALLTRHEIQTIHRIDLSVAGLEPRGALAVEMKSGGNVFKIVNMHLGLKYRERRFQMNALLKHLNLVDRTPIILLGDFNEWLPFIGATRVLLGNFSRKGLRGSFPSNFPVFRLDEIYVRPGRLLDRAWVHRTELSRVASDHLPVVGEIELSPSSDVGDQSDRDDRKNRNQGFEPELS